MAPDEEERREEDGTGAILALPKWQRGENREEGDGRCGLSGSRWP